MGMRGTTFGLRADKRHHVFRLGSLIGLRSMARFGYVMSGVLVGSSGSLEIVIEQEGPVFVCDTIYKVNRRSIIILLILN